jgi:hypothetical protein
VQPPPPLPCPPPTSSSSSLSLTAPPLRPRPPATHGRGGTLPPHRPTAPPPTADPPAAPQPPLGRRQEIPQHRPTLTSIVGSDANQPPSATTAPPPQPRAARTTSVSGIPPPLSLLLHPKSDSDNYESVMGRGYAADGRSPDRVSD